MLLNDNKRLTISVLPFSAANNKAVLFKKQIYNFIKLLNKILVVETVS